MTARGRVVRTFDRNAGRPLTRPERANLEARLASMSQGQADHFRALADYPGGRARLRDAQYVSRLSPAELAAASRCGAEVTLAGVPVDLEAIVRRLGTSERGRAALRRRGIAP